MSFFLHFAPKHTLRRTLGTTVARIRRRRSLTVAGTLPKYRMRDGIAQAHLPATYDVGGLPYMVNTGQAPGADPGKSRVVILVSLRHARHLLTVTCLWKSLRPAAQAYPCVVAWCILIARGGYYVR